MRDAVEPKPKSCWFILYCTSSIPISLRLYYMLYLFWSYHPFFLHLPFLPITCYLHIHPFQMLPSNSQTDIAIPSTQFCFGTFCFLFHVISSVLQVYSKTGRLWADMAVDRGFTPATHEKADFSKFGVSRVTWTYAASACSSLPFFPSSFLLYFYLLLISTAMHLPFLIVSCIFGFSAAVSAVDSISLPPTKPTGTVCIQVVCPDPGAEPTCPADCKTSCTFQTTDPCCPNQKVAVCRDDGSSSSSPTSSVASTTESTPVASSSSNAASTALTNSSPIPSASSSSSEVASSSAASTSSSPSQSASAGNSESGSNHIAAATTLLLGALLVSVSSIMQ